MENLIPEEELEQWMKKIPEWDLEDDCICRSFEFDSYMEGIDFVNGIAELAEEADHHPDLEVSYGMVDVTLTTHDLKGLTEQDFLLAQKIDQMFS
ncbi:MAG: 4a-hydroxytetrahydrobiopterin dehydratase [Verrucomicrobia bacterium]|nr:4a-hydroxytetrahydrobiopterin dehydratase [Verrucomicrobiota bacterium]